MQTRDFLLIGPVSVYQLEKKSAWQQPTPNNKGKHGGRPKTSLEGHFLFFPHSDYDIRKRTREEYQGKEKRE